MSLDPRRLLDTLERATGHVGLRYAVEPTPLPGGFWAEILTFRLANPPPGFEGELVLRLMPDQDRARREAVIHPTVAELGFPVPRVRLSELASDALGGPFLVMDRVRGGTIAHGLGGAERVRAFRSVPVHLAAIMAKLHELPAEPIARRLAANGWPERSFGVDALLDEIAATAAATGNAGLGRGVAWLRERGHAGAAVVVCHGDLHAFNLILAGGEVAALLDWANAIIAPPEFDVAYTALLLGQMPIVVPGILRPLVARLGRRARRRFLLEYRRRRQLADERLLWHEALHALHMLARVVEARSPRVAKPPLAATHPWELAAESSRARFAALSGIAVALPPRECLPARAALSVDPPETEIQD